MAKSKEADKMRFVCYLAIEMGRITQKDWKGRSPAVWIRMSALIKPTMTVNECYQKCLWTEKFWILDYTFLPAHGENASDMLHSAELTDHSFHSYLTLLLIQRR